MLNHIKSTFFHKIFPASQTIMVVLLWTHCFDSCYRVHAFSAVIWMGCYTWRADKNYLPCLPFMFFCCTCLN